MSKLVTAIFRLNDLLDPQGDEEIRPHWNDMISEITKLEDDSKFLNALRAAGVDNWEGYSIACRAVRGNKCESCGEPATQNLDIEPLCDDCFNDADANDVGLDTHE